MTGIAVVASASDAKFAQSVRAALQASGLDASVSQSLPKADSPHVVLIWSATLEAVHAIDAQVLIGLWSEDRLVTVRRDETPLPLGLRDLPSLSPGSTVAEVCAAVPGVRHGASGSAAHRDSQVLLGSMAELDDAPKAVVIGGSGPSSNREVKLANARGSIPDDAQPPKSKSPVGLIVAAILAVALVGGGAWYLFNKANFEKQAALTVALETATKASQELQQAQAKQQESLKALEEARAKEIGALKSGDAAEIKEAQEAAKRAEAAAAKQADAVKAREAAAADARKKAQEGAEKAKVSKAAEPMKAESVAVAPAQVAKAPEPVAKAPEPAAKAPEPAAKSAEPPRPKSRSEREREEEDRLSGQAALRRGPQVAASAPAPSSAPASAASSPTQQAADLFEQAQAMEASDPRGALKIYRSLARGGNGKAAKRLGEIYDKGIVGVSRDYAESLQWYETARQLGETVETAGRREGGPTVAPSPARAPAKPAAKERALEAPKAAPAPPPASPALPEAPKASAPAPSPVPGPEPKPAAEPAAPAHETKTGWFTLRGLLIALLVLALIAWRRSRRRQKAEARQAQRASAAANRKDAADLAAARPAQRPQAASPQAARGDATLFVSYSHKDRDRVEPVVSVIEEMGRRVWMDRSDITGQTGWAGQIVRAIRECRAVVLMASPNSYTSDQVVRELYLAMNHRKTIVPIEIEPAEMPDELQYILAPFQHHRLSGRETREVLGRALAAV